MLFFKRILKASKVDEPQDRRGGQRYAVTARFPVSAVFNAVGRDEQGQPLSDRGGQGWDWAGKLLNLSVSGARLQVPPTVTAIRGDACRLKLDLEGYVLTIPGQVAHITELRDSYIYGLALNTREEVVGPAYQQLLELVAVGATLKQTKPPTPDPSGYLLEQYEGDYGSRLDVWRDLVGRTVAAFDFQLKECHMRGLAGQTRLQCLLGADVAQALPANETQADEMERLFHWVVPNIANTVPADVREILEKFAR